MRSMPLQQVPFSHKKNCPYEYIHWTFGKKNKFKRLTIREVRLIAKPQPSHTVTHVVPN